MTILNTGLLLRNFFRRIKFLLFHQFYLMGNLSQTKVCEKVTLYNTYFADQCTPINNSSTLPQFEYKVTSNIDDVSFCAHEILSIIRSLNNNKAHGWDGISIRMIKMFDETIALPLKIIFDTALKSGSYPDKLKRANVVPVHKK